MIYVISVICVILVIFSYYLYCIIRNVEDNLKRLTSEFYYPGYPGFTSRFNIFDKELSEFSSRIFKIEQKLDKKEEDSKVIELDHTVIVRMKNEDVYKIKI